jgi:cell division septation protein DedD
MARQIRKKSRGIDARQILLALLGIVLAGLVIFVAGYQLGMKLDAPTVLTTMGESASAVPTKMTAGLSGSALENFSFFDELDEPATHGRVRRLAKGNANNRARGTARAKPRARKANKHARARDNRNRSKERLRKIARTPAVKPARIASSKDTQRVAGRIVRVLESGPSKAPAAVESGDQFTVQVATFASFDESSALVRKLRGQGMSARVVLGRAPGGKVYRVRVGRFDSRDAAQGKLGTLRSSGLKPVITKL